MKRTLSFLLTLLMLVTSLPLNAFIALAQELTAETQATAVSVDSFRGKTVSILSHSASTYDGVSNNTAYNSTIGDNDVYYTEGRHGVYREDTWWQQVIDVLDMRLLVNNSWSGSCVLQPRKGEASVAYKDRAVNLHNDHTGEEPDIIWVYIGGNDFAYYKDTYGQAADVDYDALIKANGDGSYTYAEPTTTCEAYAITLHKAATRYPEAEIYCITSTARREVDYTGDSYPDAGQPTEYSAQLWEVAAHFGYPVVDLEKAIPKDVEIFDSLMGDKRAHPNAEGMDRISEELLSVMLGKEVTLQEVTGEYDGVTTDHPAAAAIKGEAYKATLTPEPGYSNLHVTVTMGGEDITQTAYADGKITVSKVTGDLVITAKADRKPLHFRWEMEGTSLRSVGDENALAALGGTVTDGVITGGRYQAAIPMVLKHDRPWVLEWRCGGDWRGAILTSAPITATVGKYYLSRTKGGQLCFGAWSGSQYDNYGVDLSALDAGTHTFRLENRISADGSNMIYLSLDGGEALPMNNYFVGSKAQNTTSNWVSGKDFSFGYLGTDSAPLNDCKLEYLLVCEDTSLSLSYDDRYDVTGKEVEILDAGKPTSYQVGYGVAEGTLDTAVITLDGDKLIATGIGTAKVKIDGVTYTVTVKAAPISLIMITGHSMGAGQKGSATQSVICPEGQVYSSHGTTNLGSSTTGVGISYAALTKAKNVNAFTLAGEGTIGEGSALAWEYNKLTGEKVWVLNTAVGGSNLSEWIPGTTNYKNAVAQFRRAQAILSNEIRAGHYTLSDMGILYHNGANFSYKGTVFTQQDLQNWYDAMWNGFKTEFSTDLDGNGTNETASFLGLIPIWTKSGGVSYTEDEPAGLFMAASDEYPDIFTASVIGRDWLTNANVAAKFPEITYTTQNETVILRPTTTAEVFSSDNVHYLQVGYNAVGIDIARNIVAFLENEDETPEVTILTNNGQTAVESTLELNYNIPVLLTPVVEPITENDLTFTVEGCVSLHYPLQITATENGEGSLTVSHNGKVLKKILFTCKDAPVNPLSLSYDDRYDVSGKEVEILDAGKPTSYQVGYGVAEGTLDTAVVTLDGDKLIATGIGAAKVKIDGVTYTVTVKAAPISLLLLIGQSNMRGSEGDPNQSIVCPDGMVYSTYGDDRGESNTAMTVNNATSFAPSALTGPGSLLNVNGNTDCLGGYPLNSLTAEGAGRMGPDSGFAYEWVKQTGEKVWVVNAAHGGTSITTWQKGKANYEEALLLFGACQETLRKEIAAGHYTLSHMGYFWCQGCSDRTQTAKWYVEKYLAMHENLKKDLAFDEDTTFEFGGIIPVRVGSTAACYRDGVQTATNSYAYHESFVDLRMNGPRVAQYWMINNPALSDIWGICNVGDDWVWMPDGTNGVEAYFNAHYENGRVDYTTQVAQKDSWYTPTTPKAVHDSIHYNQIGYNEIGRESVRNALILLGVLEAPEVEPTVEFVSWDGFTPVESINANTTPNSETLVVPLVSPVWKSKEVTYSLSDSLTWEYYDLLAVSDTQSGTLSSPYTNQTVTVSGHAWSAWEIVFKPTPEGAGQEKRVCADCGIVQTRVLKGVWQLYDLASHMQTMPEEYCKDTNLWAVLEHDPYYFASGTKWGIHSSREVPSVTIPVEPGDKIFATSFGKAVENGHATSNGIRVTFFGEYGVVKTMDPAGTYKEFSANGGYLIAPEDAIAINVAMWNGSDDNELYVLNRDHVYENGTCAGCGKQEPKLENFDGKVISILSASTSTFEGYTPVADGFNLDHRDRYPQDNLLTHVNDTWWMQTIQELNAKLGINDSWAGSQVLNTQDTNSGDLGPDAAMASITRIKNLGANGTPDVILFFGGGNDMGRGVALGSFDPATAPTEVDLTATKWESFADAYVAAIMRLQYFYPEAKILAMTSYPMPSYVTQAKLDKYGPVVQAICDHYGVEYLSLQDCGVTFEMLPDDIHPNAEGMDYITAAVVEKLTDTFVLPAGETVVHTVTHNLSQAKASLGYYKGISANKAFEETLTGEDLTVTVTMGGVDITETAYKNGVISIPAVTGDLVITSKGKFTADGHLQQLPEVYCPATNLWQALTPEKIYYTASGWGNTSAGTTWSITFPVKEGDRIWATSLGAYPDNGSTANGVRITWFDENGVLQTLSRDVVYAEFAKNGYITAPAGAVALNVPMTGNQAHYAVYILSAEHKYQNSICTACGEKEPLIPVGWSPVPLSTEKNSDHLAYKLENGVLIFHDFGNSSMEDYGRLPDYTNSNDQLSRYSITEWYQSRADIHAVRFDETISYVGQYTLTNMDKISEIRIDNPTATVAVHAVLFSTTDRKEPLEIYAASTLNTTESWIRGNGHRKISAAVSKVTMFYTDLAHLAPALSELESALQNAETVSPSLLYEALALVKDVPQNNYNLSDYTPAIPGAESTLAFLWDLTSGSCGESVTYRITAGEEKGTFRLDLQGTGSMTAYAKQSDVPWNVVMDAITDVTIEDGVNGFCDLALPRTAIYRMHLNSPAYAHAAEKGLTIRLETLRILCIGNSHTVDYSEFLPSILKDLQNAGLETDFVISKATIGSIGLYSGRNSNINATHRSHLEALQNSAGAYKSLKNNRYDLIIIQDYMESVVDDPQTFAAGLATFIQAVRTVSEGQGTPEIAWFTDWVDIRSTGGDSALYDGNGNKIYLEVLSREQVYEKSLANIAYVEKAIAAGTPNMPDFVIHASTIKQNAMSSYLGASKLYDKNAYCLLERDTTHLTYELGRYLMGAGVLSELINHYSHVLDIDGGSLNVGNALTVENGPAATGTGSQYTGAVNEEILSIIREAISSPLQFKPSVYTQDPVDKFLQSVEEMEWNPTDEPEKEAALQLLKDLIQASFGSMVESYTVEMVSYASPYDFTFSIHVTHGYTIRKESFTIHICRYTATVTKPTCTEKGYTTYTCECGKSYVADEVAATGHSYKATITKPTCTAGGYTTYTCHCGDSYVADKVPATGHSFGEWETVKDATCTADGEQRRECANCDHFETKEIAATGHSYKATATAPTCTEGGYTTYTCHCGDSYVADKVSATGHTFSNWETTKEATCTADGEQRRDCKNCDHFETKVIAATGHSYTSVVTKPTCTTEGYTTYTCHCGDSYVADKVPAKGHTFGEWTTTKEATCTANGEQRRDCKNCDHYETKVIPATGHTYQATITKPTCTTEGYTTYTCHCGDSYVADKVPATGHSFGEWKTVKEATCTANSEQRRDCANCDHYETKAIPATGHTYQATVTKPTCTEDGYTTYTCHCGDSYVADKVPATGHSFREWTTTKEATCTVDGEQRRECANCDHYETKVISATGHSYQATITKPTCTTEGYTTYTCHCGDSYVADKTPATGHTFGEWTTTKEATCTANGEQRRECANCDAYETKVITATGHSYTATITKPTCTAEGYTTYTCHCGDSYVADKVPATGHSFGEWATTIEATCTVNGEQRRDCKNCDHFETKVMSATGHSYKATVTKPTCTAEGYTTYTCHCGDTYVADKTPATGHSFGEWATTKEATCTANGEQRRECKNCDHYETKAIPATGHSYQATITKPTCTAEGYTTYTCHCGDSYVADKVPATGHTFGNWETTKEATCTANGEQRRECKNCDHFETKAIPATGHSYQATITKPTCTEDGYTTYTCHCGDTYVADKTPATGHDYDSVVTNPTCTEKGYVTYTCKICGDTYAGNHIPSVGHSWDEGVVTVTPTEEDEGLKVYTCTTCGETKEEILPELEHVHRYTAVVTDPTCTEQGYTTYTCRCGDSYVADKTLATGHTYGEWETVKDTTCTANGEQRRECANCDHFETRTIAATGHKHEAVVTEPSCTEKGYTTYTCHCGDTYVDNYVDPTGHAWTEWHDTTPGKEERSCTACGETESRDKAVNYDVDGNGTLNQADVELLMSILVGNTETETLYDFDFDGILTIYDCVLLMQQLS